jgi:folate-binding protein YgfZ
MFLLVMQTALQQRLATNNARLGVYNGAETALGFAGVEQELRSLLSSAGVFDLGWRTKITATGKDRVRWLNGMITNNIRDLAVDHGNYNFVLTHQGRIAGDLYAYNRGNDNDLLLDTDRSQAETLIKTLGRYIIMDDVKLADISDSLTAIGICGPKAKDILAAAGIDASSLEPLQIGKRSVDGVETTLVRGPEQKPNWYDIWSHPDSAQKVWEALVRAGAEPVGTDALELWRVLQGIPQYGQDIRERDLAQETEQDRALCFTKGCYIGQEIVERIRSRGQVHRKFTGFEFADGLVAPGKYDVGGRTLAEITTAVCVPLPAGERNIGLGYIRREAESAEPIDMNGKKARVAGLPFTI